MCGLLADKNSYSNPPKSTQMNDFDERNKDPLFNKTLGFFIGFVVLIILGIYMAGLFI